MEGYIKIKISEVMDEIIRQAHLADRNRPQETEKDKSRRQIYEKKEQDTAFSLLKQSSAMLISTLSKYCRTNLFSESGMYLIWLELPPEHSERAFSAMKELAFDFLVNRTLLSWYMLVDCQGQAVITMFNNQVTAIQNSIAGTFVKVPPKRPGFRTAADVINISQTNINIGSSGGTVRVYIDAKDWRVKQ